MARVPSQSRTLRPTGLRGSLIPRASCRADILLGLYYLLCAAMVRLLPARRWRILPNLLARYQTRWRRETDAVFFSAAKSILGRDMDEASVRRLLVTHSIHVHCRTPIVCALRRRGGWNPSIVLRGREGLEAARAKGRGTILWFDAFAQAAIIGKRAFADSGYPLWHLSALGHGILNAPLAERFLNPRVIEVELRYLLGRIVLDPASTVAATRKIVEILDGNAIISITNNAYIGKTIHIPFGKGMVLPLARTPLNLAASRGAAVLPVSVIEIEPFRRYEVAVGPDLASQASAGVPTPIEAMASAYAGYLLPLVRANPGQWDGWSLLRAA